MANRTINNIKLGVFVIGGLLFLLLLLYMIGKNRSLFGNTFILKARFANIQGLVAGNNVRFSGIQTGTVKNLKIINDTTIEITMFIDVDMKGLIKKNAVVSIGTDGLVGNRVVNIVPAGLPSEAAVENDILVGKKPINTDEMLVTLTKTNNDIAEITEGLKLTVQRINNSKALWALLNDQSLPLDIKNSVANIHLATIKAQAMVTNLNEIVGDIKNGKGSAGVLLRDTSFVHNLNQAILQIKNVGTEADSLAINLNTLITGIKEDITNGKGTMHGLLKDSQIVIKLNTSLNNIQKGTDGFNQNMEALKHNFLFRGYFKKLEKQKQKNEMNLPVKQN